MDSLSKGCPTLLCIYWYLMIFSSLPIYPCMYVSISLFLGSLNLCSNSIGNEGLCSLAAALQSNSTLTQVYIWGNKWTEPTCNVSHMTSDNCFRRLIFSSVFSSSSGIQEAIGDWTIVGREHRRPSLRSGWCHILGQDRAEGTLKPFYLSHITSLQLPSIFFPHTTPLVRSLLRSEIYFHLKP